MKKKNLKHLNLNKVTITNLNHDEIRGGRHDNRRTISITLTQEDCCASSLFTCPPTWTKTKKPDEFMEN